MSRLFVPRSFNAHELGQALDVAVEATHEVSPGLRENFGTAEFDTKHGDERDWVTKWDKWAEAIMKAKLALFSREVGARGEESGAEGSDQVYWVIDPIDATSHYVRGNEFCTTMIALVDYGSPVAAVIHDFVRGDTYTAISGQGAYKNNRERLRVSDRSISQAYLELYTDETTAEGDRLRKAIENSGAYLLRSAAAGFTFVSIARGSTEGFAAVNNPYGSEHDIAPGSLLVHEAGGIVCNVDSEGFTSTNFNLIAANPRVFPALSGIIGRETLQL